MEIWVIPWGVEKNLLPGIFARLEFEKARRMISVMTIHDYFYNWARNFPYAGNRLVPADLRESRLSHGSLAGKIITDNIDLHTFGQVKLVAIQINGVRRVVPLRGNTFFVDDIETGVHRIRLDSKTFPIEFSSDLSQTYWIKIAPSAVSYVDFIIDVKAGFRRPVMTEDSTYLRDIKLVVKNTSQQTVYTTTSDQFGLYRVDALPPGSYTIHALDNNGDTIASRPVALTDTYLFDRDLLIGVSVDGNDSNGQISK